MDSEASNGTHEGLTNCLMAIFDDGYEQALIDAGQLPPARVFVPQADDQLREGEY